MRNKAQIIDINIDEIATFKGDDLPKNRAISRPDENPAPIAVPMYNAAVLNAFFTAIAYFENGKAKYVMDAAMHMIQGMDLSIVAEGVETEAQLETMKTLGIQYIQGYYFSKPLSEQHFLDFIKENNVDRTGGVA